MERLFLSTLEGSCKTPLAAFLKETQAGIYDFSYMGMDKDDSFTSGALKNLNKADVPHIVQEIAIELKSISSSTPMAFKKSSS
jgi:porphobilinogen deaminase